MTPLQWVSLFAQFAEVAPKVVSAFAEKHPELRDPPPEAGDADIYEDFVEEVAKRFPKGE